MWAIFVYTASQILTAIAMFLSGYHLNERYTIFIQQPGQSTMLYWEMYDEHWDLMENLASDSIHDFLNSQVGKTIPQIISRPEQQTTREYIVSIYTNRRKQIQVHISYRVVDREVKVPLKPEPAHCRREQVYSLRTAVA